MRHVPHKQNLCWKGSMTWHRQRPSSKQFGDTSQSTELLAISNDLVCYDLEEQEVTKRGLVDVNVRWTVRQCVRSTT